MWTSGRNRTDVEVSIWSWGYPKSSSRHGRPSLRKPMVTLGSPIFRNTHVREKMMVDTYRVYINNIYIYTYNICYNILVWMKNGWDLGEDYEVHWLISRLDISWLVVSNIFYFPFSIWDDPSHWRTPSFFKMCTLHHQQVLFFPLLSHYYPIIIHIKPY